MTSFTAQQKKDAEEYEKAMQSFVYFVENFCVIQDRKSGGEIPFKLWDGQKGCAPTIIKEKLLIILKARQLGLTWLTAAYVLWKAIFNFNELIIVISATEDLAVEFLERVKYMFDRLPAFMKPSVAKRNTTELLFGIERKDDDGQVIMEGLNSHIKSLASTPAAGQSKTISLLIIDESALGRYCKEIWGAAKPTLEHADGQAIVISNPSKDKPGWAWTRDIYTKSMAGLNAFKRIFLNWQCVPGRGDDFLDIQRMDGLDENDIIMQYPTTEAEAISAMLGSYFGTSVERHKGRKGVRAFLRNGKLETDRRGVLEIWKMPYDQAPEWDKSGWERRYAIGSDVSEGLGQTNSTAYVIDRLDESIVCRMISNKIDAYVWGNMLYELAKFYHNDGTPALICAERTGPGQTTIKRLQDLKAKQYVKIKPGVAGNPITKQYGWHESQQAKHELCGDLKTYLNNTEGEVPCAQLIDECTTFIRHDNGRLGHEDGKLDDCVMGAGCAVQASSFLGEPPEQVGTDRAHRMRVEEEIKAQNLPEEQREEWGDMNKEIEYATSGFDDDFYD